MPYPHDSHLLVVLAQVDMPVDVVVSKATVVETVVAAQKQEHVVRGVVRAEDARLNLVLRH